LLLSSTTASPANRPAKVATSKSRKTEMAARSFSRPLSDLGRERAVDIREEREDEVGGLEEDSAASRGAVSSSAMMVLVPAAVREEEDEDELGF
jgi:hypothetical protein